MKVKSGPAKDNTREDQEEDLDNAVVEEDSDDAPSMGGYHKTNVLSLAMHKLGKMNKSDLVDFYNKSMASIGHEADGVPDGAHAHNAGTLKMHPSAAAGLREAVKEDLAAVFGDNEQLTEEFKDRMTTLFEAAVGARVALVEAEMLEAHEEAVTAEVSDITEELVGEIDGYMDYILEQWFKTNEVAIQSALKSEITEEFMADLRDLMIAHNFNVPEGEQDMVEMLCAKVEELEAQLNEVGAENMRLGEEQKLRDRGDMIATVAEGLTDIQTEKFVALTEGVEYEDNPDAFVEKLEIVKEAHFNPGKKAARASRTSGLIMEEIEHSDENDPEVPKPVKPEMRAAVAALKLTIPQGVKSKTA